MTDSISPPPQSLAPPDDYHRDRDRNYADWYGWRPGTGRACPRRAVGKHCLAGSRACVCGTHRGLLEHPATFIDPRGVLVFVADHNGPVDGGELSAFITDATALGAHVSLSARSGWNPGYSILVQVVDAAHAPWRKRS